MSNRGGPTLAERSAAESTRQPQGPRQRHCWVHTPEAPAEPRPGLVIEWAYSAAGWRARVVYALDDGEHATTVETWVEAERLRPA